jgi:hypothetical protein
MISSAAAGRVGCMQVKQGSEGLFETLCAVYAIVSRQWEELAGLVQCVAETSRYSTVAVFAEVDSRTATAQWISSVGEMDMRARSIHINGQGLVRRHCRATTESTVVDYTFLAVTLEA